MTEAEEKESKIRQRKSVTDEALDEAAIKLTKKGKAPGPDGICLELVKWLSKNNRKWLLNMNNKWWEDKVAPEELYSSRVATIYKKGDRDKACNYRPISLLGSIYKLYMIAIRAKIQAEVENMSQ